MDIVIVYRELVVTNVPEGDLALAITGATPQWERSLLRRFFLSEDAFGKRAKQPGGAHTVGEQLRVVLNKYGLPSPEPADQNRVMGWRFAYNCLRQAHLAGLNVSKERAEQGPVCFVSQDCPQLMSSIPMAIRAEDALWEDCTDGFRYGLHSMLNPKTKAPRDVRAKEVYNSIQGDDESTVMTMRALAMKKFQVAEASTTRISKNPRWRD